MNDEERYERNAKKVDVLLKQDEQQEGGELHAT